MQNKGNPATIATLFGAGPATIATVERVAERGAILVAADGGLALADAAGLTPNLVVGDFDSLPDPMPGRLADVSMRHIADQDSTDFDKALQSVAADLYLCAGFLDGRTDHTLACLSSLVALPWRRAILVSETDVICLLPRKLRLELPRGTRVSVFPMLAGQARSTGLRWPLDGLSLAPGRTISTSNMAQGGVLTLESDHPHLILVLPAAFLDDLMHALLQSPVWPSD